MKNLNKDTTTQKQNYNFYVYIHIRPDINEPFYVGKGKNNRCKTKYGRNRHWHNIVNKNNNIFEYKIIFENLTEEQALLKENEVEKELKEKGYKLVNIAKTGEKGSSGVKMTDSHKKALSKAIKGRISPNKGNHYYMSDESKYWKNKQRSVSTVSKQKESQKQRWENKGNILRENMILKLSKEIIQIDIKTWSIINTFKSNKEAKEKTGIKGINNVINGRQNTAGGFLWLQKVKDRSYFEKKSYNGKEIIRLFLNKDFSQEESWHRDDENRLVEVIGETDWKFQFDDQLPISLNEPIFIPRHKWHRAIKGTGDLIIKINYV